LKAVPADGLNKTRDKDARERFALPKGRLGDGGGAKAGCECEKKKGLAGTQTLQRDQLDQRRKRKLRKRETLKNTCFPIEES
jgi:hypothetical protein